MESIEVALLLTDLVDSAAHLASMGDMQFAELMAELENDIRQLMRKFDGREIDKTDGFLVVFPTPIGGLKFALELNRHMMRVSRKVHRKLRVRSGLHFGKVVVRSNAPEHVNLGAKMMDIDGLAKVIAARVASLADAGQLLVTRTIFNLVREDENSARLLPEDTHWLAHGPYLLHGLDEPVEIYEVGEPEIAPLKPPVSKPKARRAILPQDEFILGWRPAVGHMIPSAPNWKLVRKLGEGGYGEVWLAEQHTRQLRVFKFCFNPARIRSLQREKVLLNIIRENLDSRNDIVRIIDWNMNEAPYYIALKYIPLDNLSAWMDQRKSNRPLSKETSLHIVRKAAEAIAAAHSVGILHKDVKPSNLLIGNDPLKPDIYLIDFGIGLYTPLEYEEGGGRKTNTSSNQTTLRTSSISGSQMYIAPEVIEGGRPNTQADIYAMGVILYQLLCNDLTTGLRVGWQRKIEDQFLQEIIEQATNGNLAERFATMNRFIEALDNLEERRDEAERKFEEHRHALNQRKALERATRRKNYAMVALGVAMPLAVMAGIFAYRENDANELASIKITEATQARDQANWLLGFILKDMNTRFKTYGSLPEMDEMTSKAITYYEKQPDRLKDVAAIQNHAQAYKNLADIQLDRKEYEDADRTYKNCLALIENLQNRDPVSLPLRKMKASVYQQLATIHGRKRDIDGAKSNYQLALDLRRSIYVREPYDIENLQGLTHVCLDYSRYFPAGGIAQPRLLEEATSASMEAIRFDRNSLPAQLAYARALLRGSEKTSATREIREDNCREAIELIGPVYERTPGNLPAAETLANAYDSLLEMHENNPEAARALYEPALNVSQNLVNLEPDNTDWKQLQLSILKKTINSELAGGQFSNAKLMADKAGEVATSLLEQSSTQTAFQKEYWNICRLQLSAAGRLPEGDQRHAILSEQFRDFKTRTLISFDNYVSYFHNVAVQRALYMQSPGLLSTALDETTVTTGNVVSLVQSRCIAELLQRPDAFVSDKITLADMPTTGTVNLGSLVIENQEPEVYVVRVYEPGKLRAFDEQMVWASPSGRPAVPGLKVAGINENYGISINNSPIMPAYAVTSYDAGRHTFTLKLSDWKREQGKQGKFTIPVEYNIPSSVMAQFNI